MSHILKRIEFSEESQIPPMVATDNTEMFKMICGEVPLAPVDPSSQVGQEQEAHVNFVGVQQSTAGSSTNSWQFEDASEEGMVDVVVSAENETYFEEEDVVTSQPVVPCVGMEFDTVEEARKVYNAYALKLGFSIRVGSTRNSAVTGQLIRKEFECAHARKAAAENDESTSASATTTNDGSVAASGKKRKRASAVLTAASRKRNILKKFDCKAHMAIGLREGRWRVVVMKTEHNHEFVKRLGRRRLLRSHRSISRADYELLKMLHTRNISTMKIMAVLSDIHGGLGNLTFTTRDVSNLRTQLRKAVHFRDMDATLNYFQKLQSESPSFFYAVKLDGDNAVRGLFWVDGRTRELFKSFRDCVFFDTTFCVNRYNMPFAPLVGINNHMQSIFLGCALLPDETAETFAWVFSTLREAMGGLEPQNIMTDQDKAMKAAIAQVFPAAVHRCCKFHVVSKACEKFALLIGEEEDFAKDFDCCVNHTDTVEDFEMEWHRFEAKYNLQGNDHFRNMSAAREMWAPAYFKKQFYPFTSTTGRSESMNSLFKRMSHPQESVLSFVSQYEYIMDTRAEKEDQEGCKGEISQPPLWGRYAFEKQAARFYTRSVFFKFQELLRDSTCCKRGDVTVHADSVTIQILKQVKRYDELVWKTYNITVADGATSYSCSCNMFEQDGLLCSHILKVFTLYDIEQIPEKYLLTRWSEEATTKISEHLSGETCFGVPTTNKNRYNALCRKMHCLASEACLDPETFVAASQGVDMLIREVKTKRTAQVTTVDETQNQREVNAETVKNPPAINRQGRPREKVERMKSLMQQTRDKQQKKNSAKKPATRKNATKKKAEKAPPPCSYCHEEGHGVKDCEYMAKAAMLQETQLKL